MKLEGRLINVSNRLPVEIKNRGGVPRLNPSAGGLATALDSIWRRQHGLWIGWAGAVDPEMAAPLLQKAARGRAYSFRPVPLSAQEVSKFYSGFANEIIWPLFHDMPSRCNFDPEYWEVYQRVNRKFAQTAAETVNGKDLIWAHDYHLMLMGHYLREVGCHTRTGFFLHIPFPAPDIFEKLPWRKIILRAMLDYHLIGFQTDRDRFNFSNCVKRIIPEAKTERQNSHDLITYENRRVTSGTYPISIAFEEFANHAASRDVEAASIAMRRELTNNFIVLGVDRMDYTKGIPERLKAFRILLRRYPELRHRVTLLQIVVPSREDIREYKELRREVELLVSQINGEFTDAGWVPIHYMHRNLSRKNLLGYYRAADIALITSLKDGMNLVAKEFCAAQIDEQGVVVISEFAGAAAELRAGALIINPNDFAGIAEAIHRACVMPVEEKRTRMHKLREVVKKYNVQGWAESFVEAALAKDGATVSGSGQPVDGGDYPLVAASAISDQRIA
ncbi:MAG TPA: trehalose-6-phosphate synthase [Terriglobales bacterium]|jgi:trehalose 6-phosphate synthase